MGRRGRGGGGGTTYPRPAGAFPNETGEGDDHEGREEGGGGESEGEGAQTRETANLRALVFFSHARGPARPPAILSSSLPSL